MAINTPKPISRDERYLSKIGGNEEVIVPKPISREEKYMYRAAGYDDQPIPDYPIGRNEKYWAKIIENGGGSEIGSTVTFDSGQKFISDNSSLKDYKIYGNGGEIHSTGVLPLTFTAKGGTAVDWEIKGNDDVGENLVPPIRTVNGWKQGYRNYINGNYIPSYTMGEWLYDVYIPINSASFTFWATNISAPSSTFYFFDSDKQYLPNTSKSANNYNNAIISNISPEAAYMQFAFRTGCMSEQEIIDKNYQVMLVKGSTAPDHYIPYQQGVGEQRVDGYYVPIKVTKHKSYPIQWELKGKAVRDQVTSTKGNEILTWDVIGIDHDECYYADGRRAAHSVTLQLHDCFASLTFHEREAFIAFPDRLAAGTYNFTVTTHPWVSADNGKTFQFTTTQAIAAKGQLVLQAGYNVSLSGSSIKTYSSPSTTTVLETLTLTEGSGGTSLGSANNQINGNINSLQRSLLGNNNYNQSYVRQYINSTAAAGGVWSAQNKWDRVPSWNGTTAGFLNGMDDDFLSAVGEVEKTTALNTVSDGGGSIKTYEKFFLLSRSEIYGNRENNINEGSPYDYYKNYSDYSAPNDGADTNRIKYRNGAAQYWWLRSPNATNACNVRIVNTTGYVSGGNAYGSGGVAPAICIPMDEVYDCNEVDIYIGDSPLTEGQQVSKTSIGQGIELFNGENTVSTTLYNKPDMEIETSYGVGVKDNNHYIIPFKVNTTIYNIQIGDSPLYDGEYLSYKEKKLYKYIDSVLTPIDPPSPFPEILTTEGVNKVIIETSTQPDSIFITTQNPIKLVQPNIGTKTITQNGVYNASDDNLDGYSSVTVNTN